LKLEFNIARSKADIRDSVFEYSHSDALDWDQVEGKIVNSVFKNSGNDSIYICIGNVRLIDNRFDSCGDKCISAGEGTLVSVNNAQFINCNIGVAVKDTSHLKMQNGVFDSCRIAWNFFMKK
jgi:hypothetical protein|tara:strand:+ start:307 stop:672 length:366 start_codon:yes stop_codon:yes gene_type:complete